MRYWIAKSEPSTYSIDRLKREKKTAWEGVRNYQARNFLMEMDVGDTVLFYHSNTEVPGIVGIATVTAPAVADPTQFDKKSDYYDPKATKEKPRWFCPEVRFTAKFKDTISLEQLRSVKKLADMRLLQKGNRLSVMPIEAAQYETILKLAEELQ